MSKSILKNLPRSVSCNQENITLEHTHRNPLVITRKLNYSYEELLVYLNNLDILWEQRININKNSTNYIN